MRLDRGAKAFTFRTIVVVTADEDRCELVAADTGDDVFVL
jgi:hypothetical protein